MIDELLKIIGIETLELFSLVDFIPLFIKGLFGFGLLMFILNTIKWSSSSILRGMR